MILYSVTVSIDSNIAEEWIRWMKETHVPEVMNTGCFIESKICRLIDGEEDGGLTYSFQYLAPNQTAFDVYQKEHAPTLQKDHSDRYAGKFAAFRTLLEVLDRTTI